HHDRYGDAQTCPRCWPHRPRQHCRRAARRSRSHCGYVWRAPGRPGRVAGRTAHRVSHSMRYGIYYVPARNTPLGEFGVAILVYDLGRGTERERLDVPGLAEGQLARFTGRARRYGFHATLKAPFALAGERWRIDVLKQAADIADRAHAIEISALEVAMLGDFVALIPQHASRELNALAAAFVAGLDPLRAVKARDEVKW